jgi:polyisoprenyl-phosphate glycosyltransferase
MESQDLLFPPPPSHQDGIQVSVVIPVFNEAAILAELCNRLQAVFEKNPGVKWQAIIVNDGSHDETATELAGLSQQYTWLSCLHLSRNFGHQIAITAGLDYADGDAVVIMDGDLQDPPEVIPQLLSKWQEGYDVVFATRRTRVLSAFAEDDAFSNPDRYGGLQAH